MSAYKQLLTSDVIVSPLEVHKDFTFKGNELTGSNVDISRLLGYNIYQYNFDTNLDPITGNYTITSPGTKAYYIFNSLPLYNDVVNVGSGSLTINNVNIVITGSVPLNTPTTIYIKSGSSNSDTITNIVNVVNNSSSIYFGISNISASSFLFGTLLYLEDKNASFLGNFNYLISYTGSDVGTGFTANAINYFINGTNNTVTGGYKYQRLVYSSIKELYYSNYTTCVYGDIDNRPVLIYGADSDGDRYIGSGSSQAQYFNYLQTTLSYPRFFPTASGARIGVLSIPNYLFGDYIQPNSLRVSFPFNNQTFEFYDDGEGNLRMSNSLYGTSSAIVGNVVYPHGIVTLTGNPTIYSYLNLASTNQILSSVYSNAIYGYTPSYIYGPYLDWLSLIDTFTNTTNITASFSSSYTIYETQYKCTIRENEYNYTLNPSTFTSISSSITNINLGTSPCDVASSSISIVTNPGVPYDYVNRDYFSPYITTVGLYDEQQNLLAIGKLAQPLPSSPTTDTTILINIDR